MIDQQRLTFEWLREIAKNKNADPILAEKVIRALLLLEGLVKQDLTFVFKGGTSLMLHFKSPRRLSIDVDIIIDNKEMLTDEVLDDIVKAQKFTRWQLHVRRSASSIEKAHFKFFYTSLISKSFKEDFVLLDVLVEKQPYERLIDIPLESEFIPTINPVLNVKVPTLEEILGDKLTAFAPNTTGIPYKKGEFSMNMEIIKQLYDIGILMDVVQDVSVIKNTFYTFAITELNYRSLNVLEPTDVIEDIYQTALCLASNGHVGNADLVELRSGISRLRGFIFSESYNEPKAIIHASKAAYIAMLIRYEYNVIERYESVINMNPWIIDVPLYSKLNKLKKSNPEAFFYWYKIFEMMK